jgi:hypothetical protein
MEVEPGDLTVEEEGHSEVVCPGCSSAHQLLVRERDVGDLLF